MALRYVHVCVTVAYNIVSSVSVLSFFFFFVCVFVNVCLCFLGCSDIATGSGTYFREPFHQHESRTGCCVFHSR